ncbi:MAG TPA: glycerol kinase GlpK [Symbiobacteriaceae bacterium]|nr:glycerol kinase GlpK [Symbiobacteriaceae bacterium]
MGSSQFILVIDEGTTGTRALIVDESAAIKAQAYTEFTQYHPAPDRVEHDAEEIWDKTLAMVKQALSEAGLTASDIAAVGITNQRATTVVWDKATGKPITKAIVWQDTRTAGYIEEIRADWADKVYSATGWAMSPVYSSLMIKWILDNVPGARVRADRGELLFGTIDTWLIWKLTGGKVHATGYSNVSVTGSYDLTNLRWYGEWLEFLGISRSMLPEVRDDSGSFGSTDPALFGAAIPITAAVADQHAALFGQGCLEAGTVKCTHGTGTFLDMNIGPDPVVSKNGINTVIAWKMGDQIRYALEGYAAVTGSAVQWLRDGAGLIASSAETEALAVSVPDNGGVYFVPALTGLSAPYWDSFARGMIIGISRGTTRAHLVRACLEGIVYSTRDFLETMRRDAGVAIRSVRVDGGASRNNFLMQFQADILQAESVRPLSAEATSLGAAFMAGLAVGYWSSPAECLKTQSVDRVFAPDMAPDQVASLYADWTRAVGRAAGWTRPGATN